MAAISVIGLGKLGGPLAAVLASKGHKVIGLDHELDKVVRVKTGNAPVEETGLQELIEANPFHATSSYNEAIVASEVSFVIVPTPSRADGSFSNRFIVEALESLGEQIKKKQSYHLVVICSTVMPGSMDGEIREVLEQSTGKRVGPDIGLAYNPEFIALGSVIADMLNPDMYLVGSCDDKAGDALQEILETISDAPVQRMSLIDAEIAKIAVNSYITMKISYANQLGEICERIPGANAAKVAEAIGKDSRIGKKYLTPATAYAGECFPRDSRAFASIGASVGVDCALAKATDVINDRQIMRLVRFGKRMVEHKRYPVVGILGLAYKPGTHVFTESAGLKLATRLLGEGWIVKAFDPVVRVRDLPINVGAASTAVELLHNCDIGYIMTPWPEFSDLLPKVLTDHPNLMLVDCWDILKSGPWDDTNVVRLGVG